jgi:hypothetical protein
MNKEINLKDIEKKVFTAPYQDGLLDILLGIIFSQFSIAPLLTNIGFSDFEASVVFVPVYIIALVLFLIVKKYVTKPRTGIIKPGPARKSKLIKVNIILFIILFAGFIIGLLYPRFSSAINMVFPMSFSMMILIVFSVSAYYLNLNRLYYYGMGIAVAPFVGEILWQNSLVSHHGYPLVFGIISSFLIVIGIIYFIRFMRENPLPVMEENNAG